MLSNLVLQDTINGIKNITKCELAIVGLDGKVIASTDENTAVNKNDIVSFVNSSADSQEIKNQHFYKVYDDYQVEYVVIVAGSDSAAIGKLAAFQIENLLVAYKEHFDKDNFIKNLILDNLLLVDVYNRAKRLHIDANARRVVYILESEEVRDHAAVEAVKGLFARSRNDFITAVDEKSIIIIRELDETDGAEEMHDFGEKVIETVSQMESGELRVAYGNAVGELKDISRSYKEARMALDVGKIFFEDLNVVAFSQLGIGRLIYQLPIPLCRMFIREIFTDKSPDDFDEETLATINKFFENSLNVSETSRQLYIHRNTLVYRLDKLQKSTGLDLRVFDDAITFKIALMVVKYMNYMETLDY